MRHRATTVPKAIVAASAAIAEEEALRRELPTGDGPPEIPEPLMRAMIRKRDALDDLERLSPHHPILSRETEKVVAALEAIIAERVAR